MISFQGLELLISLILKNLRASSLEVAAHWEIKKGKPGGEKQMALPLQAKPDQEGRSTAHVTGMPSESSSGSKAGYKWKGDGGGDRNHSSAWTVSCAEGKSTSSQRE